MCVRVREHLHLAGVRLEEVQTLLQNKLLDFSYLVEPFEVELPP